VTLPRRIIPGATQFITRRCSRREFRLSTDQNLKDLMGYCMAVSAERHGVQVHAVMCMPNHYHSVVSDPLGRLPDFMRDLNSVAARGLNGEQSRWEAVWSSQRSSQVALVDREDIWRKLVYTLTNPATAGLVDRLSQWPGFKTRPVDIERAPRVFRRPKIRLFGERSTMPDEATLELTVPEAMSDMTTKAFVEELQMRVAQREAELRAERRAAGGRVLGAREIRQLRHDESPRSKAVRRGRDPAIAAKNTRTRVQALRALRAFRDAYRRALEKRQSHQAPVTFPYGTFKMRDYPGIVIGLPPPGLLAV